VRGGSLVMSTYVNMPDGPASVANTGIQLKALATEFDEQAKGVLAEIKSLEAGRPWGNDETGMTFAASYNQVPAGGGEAFSQSLRDELSAAGKPLGVISDAVVNAVANYQITDVDSSNAIDKV
jgi:hypothetical protein